MIGLVCHNPPKTNRGG